MKVLIALVFMGWPLMIVMMPTNRYRNIWSSNLLSTTNSTYFGKQGYKYLLFMRLISFSWLFSSLIPFYAHIIWSSAEMYMLIYTFPILFISVLGCVYIHMVKRSDNVQTYGYLVHHSLLSCLLKLNKSRPCIFLPMFIT